MTIGWLVLAAAVPFVVMQLVPYGRDRTNPPVLSRALHFGARLSPAERDELIAGLVRTFGDRSGGAEAGAKP